MKKITLLILALPFLVSCVSSSRLETALLDCKTTIKEQQKQLYEQGKQLAEQDTRIKVLEEYCISNFELLQERIDSISEAKNNASTKETKSNTSTNSITKGNYSSPTTTLKSKKTSSSSSSSSSGRTIYTGPRGGKYYINSNGNKTYIKR